MLELFKKDTCPYCLLVMDFIAKQGHDDIVYRDILRDEDSRRQLVRVGGKQQVPCLFVDGEPLYESSDIIAWLKANH